MAKNTDKVNDFRIRKGDLVRISLELFDITPRDGITLSQLGYKPHTDYFVKGFEYDSNKRLMKALIHPDQNIKTVFELVSVKNPSPVAIYTQFLLKNFGSDKMNNDFIVKNGRKACPFCRHGKFLNVRRDSISCTAGKHTFWIDTNTLEFRLERGGIKVIGNFNSNQYDFIGSSGQPITCINNGPPHTLIYKVLKRIKLQSFN